MSNPDETLPPKNQVIRVHRFDPQTSTSKQKKIIQLGDAESLEDKTLKEVRKILIDNAVFESKDLESPFCEKDGSDVGDDMKVDLYSSLLGIKSVTNSKLDFYFKKKKLFTKVDQATQEFIKQKLDLAFQSPPEVLKKNPQLLTSSFDPSDWKAVQGELSHAADLNEREWSVIVRSNCLLNGYQVVLGLDKKPQKVERCAYNAFKINPREFESYEISQSIEEFSPSDDAKDPTESNDSKKIFKSRIPRFRVDDNSSVTVVETKNAFEKSCADSSFLEASFQMAGSVGIFGVSAGVSAGVGGGSSDNNNKAEKENKTKLTVNYNVTNARSKYPRVTMYWDPSSLAVTTECLNEIRTVTDPESLRAFNEKFGVLFARRIQLGGRLSYTEASTATGSVEVKDHANKLKVAASASISHSFAQASVKSNHEKQSREVKENSKQNLTRNLAWEATGGDTLLCNNPAEWCGTVGLYTNWRIVKQDNVIPLYHFLASFPEVGEKIIERFDLCAQRKLTNEEVAYFSRLEDEDEDEDQNNGDLKTERRQIFQLQLPQSDLFFGVSDGVKELVQYARRKMLVRPSISDLETLEEAGASIKCTFEESNRATHFIADTVFVEGEEEKLKFGEPFKIRSWGDSRRQWVRALLPFLKRPGILPLLLHLYQPSGVPFTLVDAKDSGNKGYVPDGALVHLMSGYDSDMPYTAVEVVQEQGFVIMTQLRKPGTSGYVKPMGLIYRAKEIVEV